MEMWEDRDGGRLFLYEDQCFRVKDINGRQEA
jgi:hypothetical protein